jgi:transcriptional regulator with XRE-family HTH domain
MPAGLLHCASRALLVSVPIYVGHFIQLLLDMSTLM